MDPGVQLQRVYVGEERIQEVLAQARILCVVEDSAVNEIPLGLVEDLDAHYAFSRILDFAVLQSEKRDVPCRARSSRAANTSACHPGEVISSGAR